MRTLILASAFALASAVGTLAATVTLPGQLAGDAIPAAYSVHSSYLVVRNNAFTIEVDARGGCHVEFHWQCPGEGGKATRDGSTQPVPANPGNGTPPATPPSGDPGTPPGTDPGTTPPANPTDPPAPGCIPVPTNVCQDAVAYYGMPAGSLKLEGPRCYYVADGKHVLIGVLAGVPSLRWVKLLRGASITATTSAASLVLDLSVLGRARSRVSTFHALYGLGQ